MLTITPKIRRAKLNWRELAVKIIGKFGFHSRVKCMIMLFHSPLEIFVNLVKCKTTKDWNFSVVMCSIACVASSHADLGEK